MKQKKPKDNIETDQKSGEVTWGPKLFIAAAVAILAFFYWLLIYSGGVTVYHG